MKKYIRILLILFTITLCGCSKEITSENSRDEVESLVNTIGENADISEKGNPEDSDSNSEAYGWIDTHIALNHSYDHSLVTGAYIYSSYQAEGEVHIVCQDKADGSIVREIAVPGIARIEGIQADGAGNIYLTASGGDKSAFLQIDSAGNICTFGDTVLEDMENAMQAVDSKGIYTDDNGLYYLWYELGIPCEEIYDEEEFNRLVKEDPMLENAYGYVERIYVKDSQMHTLFYVQIPSLRGSRLICFYMDEEGIPTFLAEDTEGLYMQQIDIQQQKKSDKVYLDAGAEIPNDATHVTTAAGGFLYCLNGYLYAFHYDTLEHEQLMSLADYGLSEEGIMYFGMREDKIECISNEEVDGTATYTVLEKGSSEKTILTLGTLYPTEELSEMVSRYNKQQTNVRITIAPYWEDGMDYEEARTKLYMDIMTGNAPDILNVSDLNYSVLAEKDIFVDLYTCMEQDEELQKSDLIASVIQPYERNGKLYVLAPAFQMYTMWGRSDVVQGASGVSLKQFKKLLADSGKDLSDVSGFSADEPVLVTLCTFGMDELINWDEGTCDFEGQYFKDILEFTKEYEESKAKRAGKSISDGEIVITGGGIYEVSDYQIACARFGEKLSVIGYPTSSGSGTAVSLRGTKLAINAKEEHIEEAWEFVKYYTLHGYEEMGFPVLKSLFEETLQAAQEPIWVSDSSGTYQMAHGTYFDGNNTIPVYEADSEDVELIRSLVENATNVFEYDTAILNIIQEESEPYFAGQKSFEQVAEIIQNRVQLYLSE